MEPTFHIPENIHSTKFKEALNIYLQSFPSNERQEVSVIEQRVQNGLSLIFTAELSNKTMAFGLLWPFENSRFVLLDYLAVAPDHRQSRLGSALFRHMAKLVNEQGKTLVVETEHPEFGDNREERKKRLAFYFKNGCYLLKDVPYILPPLDGTLPTEMCLLVHPPDAVSCFTPEEIKQLSIRLYRELYGKNLNDATLQEIIHKLPSKITLLNTYYDQH